MPIDLEIIAVAKAAMEKTGIPASVSIAQYGLESGWGKHIPLGSNNPFGIKEFRPNHPHVNVSTREFVNGGYVTVIQPFAKYASLEDAFIAHANLLKNNVLYGEAFKALPNIEEFVIQMAKHYATDPLYAKKLLGIIHFDNLTQYDKGV